MKYKITIEKVKEGTEAEKYPSMETIYEQLTDDDVTEEVICAVNNLTPQ